MAIYHVAPAHNFEFQLTKHWQVSSESGGDMDSRLRRILNYLEQVISDNEINVIVAEQPSKMPFSKEQIHGFIQLNAICYGLVAWCHSKNLYIRTVEASQWQINCPKEKGASKKWSLEKANGILSYLKSPLITLKTGHHMADAINIGMHAIIQWNSCKWELPTLFSFQG